MSAELPVVVPGPVPPDDREAWYAPDVRSQYHVGRGVVATVTEVADGFHYRAREPFRSERERRIGTRIEGQFADSPPARPRTREGAIERMAAGLPDRWRDRFAGFADLTPAGRRRLEYHLSSSLRAFGSLTALALDERIRIADTSGERLTVHTEDFAPVNTDRRADTPHLDRFLSERVETETVAFGPFEVPVTIVRRHLLGDDAFATLYAVREPDMLPGDEELIETVKNRLVESPPGRVLEDPSRHVTDRARTLLARRLRFRDSRGSNRSGLVPLRGLATKLGLIDPTLEPATLDQRVEDLSYYVVRDLVGDAELTVPIRDPRIGSVEANRVGDRVKVLPHPESSIGASRMPTTLSIDDGDAFVGLARSIAAEGGVELSTHRPAATVEIERDTGDRTHRMQSSVSLPGSNGEAAHISIGKRRAEPRSPIELVAAGTLSAALVAAVWTVAVKGGNVLFVGPVDAEPASVLEAHVPFVPADARPVAVQDPASPVDVPHETAVAIPRSTPTPDDRGGPDPGHARTRDALHPDVVVLSSVGDGPALARFGSELTAGRSVFAASRADGREQFLQLARDNGLAPGRIGSIDVVVELPAADSAEATGWVPRASKAAGEAGIPPVGGGIEWDPLFTEHDGTRVPSEEILDRLAPGAPADLRAGIRRRVQYVRFLAEHEMTDREALLYFLADLRTDEAATVERIQRSVDR